MPRDTRTEQEIYDAGPPPVVPLHPAFTGKYGVLKSMSLKREDSFTVDLDKNTCDCEIGSAFVFLDEKRGKWNMAAKWVQSYCIHKIKAMASILDKHPGDEDMLMAYLKAMRGRYNPFETVSAFHKELRRGDVRRAIFFAHMLIPHRGLKNVAKYMLNIIYAETRDHDLHGYLIDLCAQSDPPLADVCKAIHWFCKTPKKWELPHRLDIFVDEQDAYKKLAKEFGYNVARPKDIIPGSENQRLLDAITEGYATGDRKLVQYGLKGFFKSKHREGDHEDIKQELWEHLVGIWRDPDDNRFEYDHEGATRIMNLVAARIRRSGFGYHEINAFADALCGEPFGAGIPSHTFVKAILRNPKPPSMHSLDLLGKSPPIPLYAHDNHTWKGKDYIARFPHELYQTAEQRNMDIRWCGAYMGVGWRLYAFQQHGSVNVKWNEVRIPKGMWDHLRQMFY